MKIALALAGILLIGNISAQQSEDPAPKCVIYGTVVDQDGQPAKGIGLTAMPLGVGLGTMLPTTKTDTSGKYRFEGLPWWGRYTVYAEDEKAGYASYASPPVGPGPTAEVTLSPQHPEAEFNFRLPPKAGFLHIHLTNRKTSALIKTMEVKVTSQEDPDRQIFSEGCFSDRIILLPPDKDLLLHVTSRGFLEWDESVGLGKPIRIASGNSLDLDVQLEPVD